MNDVLVLATHPDDETLGCAGVLLKHKNNNDRIHWLIATDIKVSDGFNQDVVAERENEIKNVNELYGFSSVHRLNLSTMKIDECTMSDLIENISHVINQVKPAIIYLPFKTDVHSDHRKIFEAAYSCTKVYRFSL